MSGYRAYVIWPFAVLLSACASMIAPYDATFDQTLNKLSEDTARFIAAASTGGPERSFNTQVTVAYYATTYNVLDRLIQRASFARGSSPCTTDALLSEFASSPSSKTTLPEDYLKLDCLEFQLYSIRLYVNEMEYLHESGGILTQGEARKEGNTIQSAIMGALETFLSGKA